MQLTLPWKLLVKARQGSLKLFFTVCLIITAITSLSYFLITDSSTAIFPFKVFDYFSLVYKSKLFNDSLLDTNSSVVTRNSSWNLSYRRSNGTLQLCPIISPYLKGTNIELINKLKVKSPSWEEVENLYPQLLPGGRHRPLECISRHKVAIIIPYRNRDEHLRVFLYYMHSFMERQQLNYGIYVVEQMGNNSFNRAMLMNIGFREANLQYKFQCFIFHDVDLLPEMDQNMYVCSKKNPRHFSASIDTHGYKLPYTTIFGGVGGLTLDQVEKVNGLSNSFWGWGGEDDDLSNRLIKQGYHILRYPQKVARYTMMRHKKEKPSPQRFQVLHSGPKRYKTDGINSLVYEKVNLILKKSYTLIQVKISQKATAAKKIHR